MSYNGNWCSPQEAGLQQLEQPTQGVASKSEPVSKMNDEG